MAFRGKLIEFSPQGTIEIKGRQRFKQSGSFEGFIDELTNTFKKLKAQNSSVTPQILDCDLSQNPITTDQFEMFFMALAAVEGGPVRVQRFRLFGCPTLDDNAIVHLAAHLRQGDLTADSAPAELHLSDCTITTDGFNTLMSAIEDTELYPTTHPNTNKKVPLYLRLENNYIEEAAIQAKVDQGIIRPFKKQMGAGRADIGAKVDLVVRAENAGFQQKQGVPPAPEDAPPPKEVFDKWQQEQWRKGGQKGEKGGWMQNSWPSNWQAKGVGKGPAAGAWGCGKGAGAWSQPSQLQQNKWSPPFQPQQQQGKGGWTGTIRPPGAQIRPVAGGPRPVAPAQKAQPVRPGWQQSTTPAPVMQKWTPGRPAVIAPAARTTNGATAGGKGATSTKGTAGSSADRSRTPAGRNAPEEKKLPKPWEQHWSDDYNIPYYWNSETGEALWEKPAHWG